MARQTVALFDLIDRPFEDVDADVLASGRVERHGKQELLAARALGDSLRFLHRAQEIVGYEAAYLVNLDMLVLGLEQMKAERLRSTALGCFEDHDSSSVRSSASMSIRRISPIWRMASFRSDSISGVTGSAPIWAALAS